MPKEIKIVRFQLSKRDFTDSAERELAELMNNGFVIIANGGAGEHAYVILEKDSNPARQAPPPQRPPQQRPA
ncbi:MAG: hypothetical protein JXB47_04550 [Anaerolineae bacterium]|nr:hypothetical protein [Anaerolineae bacterium]